MAATSAIVVLAPVAADARSISIGRGPIGGPALGGDGVAWVERRSGGAEVRLARFGGPVRQIQVLDESESRVGFAPMEASSSRVLVAPHRFQGGPRLYHFAGTDVFAGAWGEPLRQVRPLCEAGGDISTDVDGDLIAYLRCAPDPVPSGYTRTAIVTDFSSDPPNSQTVENAGFGLRVAGRYLAWLERYRPPGAVYALPYDVVVYDRVAGKLVYRIRAAALKEGVRSFDLQADGKLAIAFAVYPHRYGQAVTRVGWASPVAPKLHVLPLPAAQSYSVRIANNTIAFARSRDPSGSVVNAKVGIATLGGRFRTIVRNAEVSQWFLGFDYDGRRIAWLSYGCSTARVEYLDASAQSGPGLHRQGCRLTFLRPPTILNGKTLKVDVDCFGFEACIVQRLTATRRTNTAVVARGRDDQAALTPLGRSLLRRDGHLNMRLTAIITDGAGRRESRSVRVVVPPPK
jgi:hypothetical protein